MRERDEQKRLLSQVRSAKVPYKYNPLRKNMADIFQAASPLFPARVVTPWPVVARKIIKVAESPREAIENLRVAKILYDLSVRACDHVVGIDVEGLKLGLDRQFKDIGGRLTFWAPYVLYEGDRSFVTFLELRRKGGCETAAAQHFVFSMMHHSIREADPDLADVELAIAYMPGGKKRSLTLLEPKAKKFMSIDELQDRVEFTYSTWFEVLFEREQKKRAAG
jgi:hypothetical protein